MKTTDTVKVEPILSIFRYVQVFAANVKRGYLSIGKKNRATVGVNCHSPLKLMVYFLLFLQLIEGRANGTAIVILFNSDRIVIGADSKEVDTGGTNKLCKIYKTGTLYWAMSGILEWPKTHYDVAAIVRQSYADSSGGERMLSRFQSNVEGSLTKTLRAMRKSDPKLFSTARYNPLQISFWKFENGRPVIYVAFYTTKFTKGRLSLDPYQIANFNCNKDNCTAPRRGIITLGVHAAIINDQKVNPKWGVDVESATRYINLSIGEQPTTVGNPVSVLTVTENGAKWDAPNEYCHDTPTDRPAPIKPAT